MDHPQIMAVEPQFRPEDYTVGWLCAIAESELTAARRMLDRRHTPPPVNLNQSDRNTYLFGEIHGHNVVITCMPPGQTGNVSAQRLVSPLQQSFPRLAIHFFVGIGGGIPRYPPPEDPFKDIHLGDVVVGWADQTGVPGIVQHDHTRERDGDQTDLLGLLDKPSLQVLNALNPIISDRVMKETKFHWNLKKLEDLEIFQHPGLDKDILFEADYLHVAVKGDDGACSQCGREHLAKRQPRNTTDPQFHQGTILSGESVINNAQKRDQLSKKYYNAKCIEMEAAGVIDDTHCLVIRGISDYADGHKPASWEYYAAATAAAFAREILSAIRPALMDKIKSERQGTELASHREQVSMEMVPYTAPDDGVLSLIEHGERLMERRSESIAEDLVTALNYFRQARKKIIQAGNPDPVQNLRVNFRLMTTEMDITHDRNLSIEDRIAHHRSAKDYGVIASRLASTSPRPGADAQVKLEQAFLKGRKAELEDKRGADGKEIQRVKEEALKDMKAAMQRLSETNLSKFKAYETRVTKWQKRLHGFRRLGAMT